MTFKEYIRTIRKQNGIPIKEVLKTLDISISTFNRIEDDNARPHPDLLKEFAKAIQGDYAYMMELLGYTSKPNPSQTWVQQSIPLVPWTLLPGIHTLPYEAVLNLAKEKMSVSQSIPKGIALTLQHDLWAPFYQSGDILFAELSQNIADKDLVLLLKEESSKKSGKQVLNPCIRKVVQLEKSLYFTEQSFNPHAKPELITKTHRSNLIGKVVKLERSF